MKELKIILGGEVVGTVQQTTGGERRISYLLERRVMPLSVSMPVREVPYSHRVAEPFLEGLLPDNAAVREALARRFNVSPRNPFALLEHVGHDCAGAVQFAAAADVESILLTPGNLVPLDDIDLGARLAILGAGRSPLWLARGEGWSLAGAQSKIALRRIGEKWFEAHGSAATTHILKSGISGMREQALGEHLCLSTARELGLPAVGTSYEEIGGQEVIVIERYDRQTLSSSRGDIPEVRRIHQEDLCQATATYPRNKYEVNGGPGVRDIVTLLHMVTQDEGASIRRFIDALIVNVLLGAPDAHAKNYSLIHAAGRCSLAPLYDLASGLPYGQDGRFSQGSTPWNTVAMSIGGARKVGEIDAGRWERFAHDVHLAQRARMDGAGVVERVGRLAELLPDALASVIQRERRDNAAVMRDKELPAVLLDAVASRCRQARGLL